MPVQLTTGRENMKPWQFYSTRLGWDVYNSRSLTGMARSTIDDLVGFITGGLVTEERLPVKIKDVTARLLASGGIVINQPRTDPEFVDDVFVRSETEWYQYLRDRQGVMNLIVPGDNMDRVYTEETRVFRLEGSTWKETLVKDMGTASPQEITGADLGLQKLDVADILVFPAGRGLLYWGQHIFNALEENARTMRHVMTGINLLPIISGNVGNAEDARTAIETAINAIVFPGDIQVNRVISEAIINQLAKEASERRRDYIDSMNVVEKDTPNRPVASDRETRSAAMMEFVRTAQAELRDFYLLFGVNIEFGPFEMATAETRIKEFDLMERMEARRFITPEELSTKSRALIGLAPVSNTTAKSSNIAL